MTWTNNEINDHIENSSFADLYGGLTVEQALELNQIAKETCGLEATSETGEE